MTRVIEDVERRGGRRVRFRAHEFIFDEFFYAKKKKKKKPFIKQGRRRLYER